MRWDNVVDKLWKEVGGDRENIQSIEKFGGYKVEVKERAKERERLTLGNEVN